MSNFTAKHEKYAIYLQELYKKHRTLDNEIIEGYKKAIYGYEKLRNKNGYGLFWNAIIKAKEKVQKWLQSIRHLLQKLKMN